MKKKKILFLYGPLYPGGAERVLIDILRNFDFTKYEVTLCLIVKQGLLLNEVPKEVKMISLWDSYCFSYKLAYRMSVWFANSYLFKQVLKKKIPANYDVEISFLEGMPLKLHALMPTSAKKITWVHCDLFNFPYEAPQFFTNEELAAYNKMDAVVCVSHGAKLAFQKRFPTCTTNVEVVYNPIDRKKIELLAQEKIVNNSIFTIVCVGRLTMQKKIHRVIRLASRMKAANYKVQFQIVGDGELRTELEAQVNALHIADCVTFLGYQSNPFPYIKNSDMLLFTSGFEGFGLVICEAMVLGVPVVSTKTAGPIEIIDDNRYGLLCDHDDESIFQTVKKLIDDEKLREHYQKVGYKRALDFSVENTIKQLDVLLN